VNARVKGGTLALPTEAQWEYACRAGTTTPFHFGETISTDQANYDGRFAYGAGRKGANREKTVPVGSFPGNAWGLHDMHGNVEEWCSSPSTMAYDGSETKGAEADALFRAVRGGSWISVPKSCRSADRGSGIPAAAVWFRGFRAVLSVQNLHSRD
jgi:formylglycine-generating enzyme required for sulfatase activity